MYVDIFVSLFWTFVHQKNLPPADFFSISVFEKEMIHIFKGKIKMGKFSSALPDEVLWLIDPGRM